jgi:hypothetical protein
MLEEKAKAARKLVRAMLAEPDKSVFIKMIDFDVMWRHEADLDRIVWQIVLGYPGLRYAEVKHERE